MTGNAAGQRREEKEMAPTMSRGADEAGHGNFAILQLAQIVSQANDVDEILGGLLMNHAANFVGDEIGIGARRLVAFVAPGLVGGYCLAADELQRLGAGLVAQSLALQMGGDRKNLHAVLLGQLDSFLGISLGAGIR